MPLKLDAAMQAAKALQDISGIGNTSAQVIISDTYSAEYVVAQRHSFLQSIVRAK